MALTNIAYGSLASSSVMNSNFQYLDNKITTSTSGLSTNISSLSSNIATINSRLSEIAEDVEDAVDDLEEEISSIVQSIGETTNSLSMLPQWSSCVAIGNLSNYSVPSNGYIIAVPGAVATGYLTINGVSTVFKYRGHENDNSSQWVAIPVKKNDVVTCTCGLDHKYFLPVCEGVFGNA